MKIPEKTVIEILKKAGKLDADKLKALVTQAKD